MLVATTVVWAACGGGDSALSELPGTAADRPNQSESLASSEASRTLESRDRAALEGSNRNASAPEAATTVPTEPPGGQGPAPPGDSRLVGTDGAAGLGGDRPPASAVRARVKLIALGAFDPGLLTAVESALGAELDVSVETTSGIDLPRAAYYPPRHRYRADRLLDFLRRRFEDDASTARVLGLTEVDISTTKGRIADWGVFGLGEIGGRSCVISTFRLRRRARDPEHLQFRVVSTAVHEVGHTLGLEHCPEPRCVMNDAEGSIRTVDQSTGHICHFCEARLDQHAPRTAPADDRIPGEP